MKLKKILAWVILLAFITLLTGPFFHMAYVSSGIMGIVQMIGTIIGILVVAFVTTWAIVTVI